MVEKSGHLDVLGQCLQRNNVKTCLLNSRSLMLSEQCRRWKRGLGLTQHLCTSKTMITWLYLSFLPSLLNTHDHKEKEYLCTGSVKQDWKLLTLLENLFKPCNSPFRNSWMSPLFSEEKAQFKALGESFIYILSPFGSLRYLRSFSAAWHKGWGLPWNTKSAEHCGAVLDETHLQCCIEVKNSVSRIADWTDGFHL